MAGPPERDDATEQNLLMAHLHGWLQCVGCNTAVAREVVQSTIVCYPFAKEENLPEMVVHALDLAAQHDHAGLLVRLERVVDTMCAPAHASVSVPLLLDVFKRWARSPPATPACPLCDNPLTLEAMERVRWLACFFLLFYFPLNDKLMP